MAKKNWKKEYNEIENKNDELYGENDELLRRLEHSWEGRDRLIYCFFLILVSIALVFFLLWVFGAFDSPLEELEINKDTLAREFVLEYYPEFENCSIFYDDYKCRTDDFIEDCPEAVEIYCGIDDRDGLTANSEKEEPDEVLYFIDTTLEEIFRNKIESCS